MKKLTVLNHSHNLVTEKEERATTAGQRCKKLIFDHLLIGTGTVSTALSGLCNQHNNPITESNN